MVYLVFKIRDRHCKVKLSTLYYCKMPRNSYKAFKKVRWCDLRTFSSIHVTSQRTAFKNNKDEGNLILIFQLVLGRR